MAKRDRKADERKPDTSAQKKGGQEAQKNPKVIGRRFQPGNEIWKLSPRRGPDPIYSDPADLWEDCLSFFADLEERPIMAQKVVSAGGVTDVVEYELPRAPTIQRLCIYLGISRETWRAWGDSSALSDVVARVNDMLSAEKIEGALVKVYDPHLVSRIEGLSDKQEVTNPDGSLTPKAGLDFASLPKEMQLELLRIMQERDKNGEGETKGN